MPRDALRCSRCHIPLDPGAERCPRCLRKSSVVGGEGPAAGRLDNEPAPLPSPERPPRYVGVRAAALLGAYLVFAPILVLVFTHEAALTARGLWLPAGFAALMLATLPLRMAFAAPEASSSAREAAREYAIRMAAVLGFAAWMAVAQILAARIAGETPVAALLLGLLLFLLPLFAWAPIAAAARGKVPVRTALAGVAKQAGLALVVVVAVALLALRPHRSPPTIVVPPPDAQALLDPMDLASVRVRATWEADEAGAGTLYLRADAPDFDRTLQRLAAEAMGRVSEVAGRPGASGAVILVIPARFEGAESERKAGDEDRRINDALASAHRTTAAGKPIRVRFVFGR